MALLGPSLQPTWLFWPYTLIRYSRTLQIIKSTSTTALVTVGIGNSKEVTMPKVGGMCGFRCVPSVYILLLCIIRSKFIYQTVAWIWIITIFYYTMLLKFTENALTLALKSIGILKGPERLRWHVLVASFFNFYGQVRFRCPSHYYNLSYRCL